MSETVRAAIEAENYEAALAQLDFASASYDAAILRYVRARTLHHLSRFEDAEAAYNEFLNSFGGCADPDGLMDSARTYRNLAVQEHAAQLRENTSTPTSDGGLNPGWIVFGSGAALVVSGIMFDLVVSGLDDDLEAAYNRGDTREAAELEDDRDTGVIVEAVLYGGGAAAILIGSLMIILQDEASEAQPVSVGWQPTRGGSVYSVEVMF